MQEITATYWMIIIGFLTFFFCLVLFYIVLLIKETRDVVRESKEILQTSKESVRKISKVIDTLESTVNYAKVTVEQISSNILLPFNTIGNLLDRLVGGIGGKFDRKVESNEDPSIEDMLSE